MGFLNWLTQIFAVATMNLRTLRERRGASLATVFGVACVVAVFVAVLSIAQGFERAMKTAGSPDNALVLRAGNDSEMMSAIIRTSAFDPTQAIAHAPGVRSDEGGPLASAELFVVVDLPKRTTGTPANVPLRGVQRAAVAVRGNVRITAGRMFEWGKNEIVVGESAVRQFSGLEIGARPRWGGTSWEVVGHFAADGALWESELWCDEAILRPAYRRQSSWQSVVVKLDSPEALQGFKDALTTDPRLDVQVERQSDYYAHQSRALVAIIQGLGSLIALLMGIGAVFGSLNTMYSAVSARKREIATLRALGFRAGPVVVSVLVESTLLALAGGALGATVAYFAFDGFRTSTLNWSSFSQVAFAFEVTPRLLVQGTVWALLMGLVGGLFPAIRAARQPVVNALREL